MDQTNAGIAADNAAYDALGPFIADQEQRTAAGRAVIAALLDNPVALQALLGGRSSSVTVSQRMGTDEAGSTIVVGYISR